MNWFHNLNVSTGILSSTSQFVACGPKFCASASLWCASCLADMIDSVVDRSYRTIRISNRMRLTKLLWCRCCEKDAVMTLASISRRLRCLHEMATSHAPRTMRHKPYLLRLRRNSDARWQHFLTPRFFFCCMKLLTADVSDYSSFNSNH